VRTRIAQTTRRSRRLLLASAIVIANLTALCIAPFALAEQPWPAKARGAAFISERTAALPASLRTALLQTDEFTQGRDRLPESLKVWRVDLNGDAMNEFIIQSPQPYSGGPMLYVFEERQRRFIVFGEAQGDLYIAARTNGYADIVATSRAGSEAYTRVLLRYDNGKYLAVRIADYRLVAGRLEFVRERTPPAR
jgi:hypothetical protein